MENDTFLSRLDPMSRRICPFCGEPIPAPVLTCPHCGRRVGLPVVVFLVGLAVAVAVILYVVWSLRPIVGT